jgi:hypothetical protein
VTFDLHVCILIYIVHYDPSQLHPIPNFTDAETRRGLWWWLIDMDQQYSRALGRLLAIPDLGTCSQPQLEGIDPRVRIFSLARLQMSRIINPILSSVEVDFEDIGYYYDSLASILASIPEKVQFSSAWLDESTSTPLWPVDVHAATLHWQIHASMMLLYRKSKETHSEHSLSANESCHIANITLKGYGKVLQSCREILFVFEYFNSKQSADLMNWVVCQQAFDALDVLVNAMLKQQNTDDYLLAYTTQNILSDLYHRGLHQIAGLTMEKLNSILNILHLIAGNRGMSVATITNLCPDRTTETQPEEPFGQTASNQVYTTHAEHTGEMDFVKKENAISEKRADVSHSACNPMAGLSSEKQKQPCNTSLQKLPNTIRLEQDRNFPNETCQAVVQNCNTGHATVQGCKDNRNAVTLQSPIPFCVARNQNEQQKSCMSRASSATNTGFTFDRFFFNQQSGQVSTEDLQSFIPELRTSPLPYNNTMYTSQTSSEHSYPSSAYTRSVTSPIATPADSHPVSPNISHGQLGLQNTSTAFGCTQLMVQPSPPSWSFEVITDGLPVIACDPIDHSSLTGQKVGLQWNWQA